MRKMMSSMKKVTAVAMTAAMCISLTGCGGGSSKKTVVTEAVKTEAESTEETEAVSEEVTGINDSEMAGILAGTTWAGISSQQEIMVAAFDEKDAYLAIIDTDGEVTDLDGYWKADFDTFYLYANEDYSDDPTTFAFDWYTTENGEYIQLDDIVLSSEGDGSNMETTLDQMMTTASVIEYVAQGTYWIGSGDETAMIFYFEGDQAYFDLLYNENGEIQTQYGYDAFGNRTWKEERGEQTSYQYNALNQLVSERQGEIRKEYGYDKRGNLTAILENGAWKKRYVYGAMNRLEEAVDAAGKQARYQYNGLGHRVGKQEGVLPKEKLEKLDPQRRVGMEIGNSRQITYTLDLTRQYYNLLERTEESQSQRYFWDGNVAAYEENGERNYYLQDELGSPLRLEDSVGTIKENYGYGAFGEDLYQNQGKIQPFGYTGYQRDEIAGTYYAQAREYLAENGRFAGQDLIVGFIEYPETLNRYGYCWDNPFKYVDYDGEFPTIIAGAGIGFLVSGISSIVTQVVLDRKVNLKEVAVDAVSGAVKGGIAGSGIGIVGGILATGATGAATSVASQIYADDKKLNEVDWNSVVIAGGIDAVTYGVGKYKIKGKGPTVQEQLRKTNDDVYKAKLHKAGYDKKRQHGKSYQRAIKKVSELEELQDSLAEKWLKEKKTDGIKEIGENFGKKLQEKVMILQLGTTQGINNVERCEA